MRKLIQLTTTTIVLMLAFSLSAQASWLGNLFDKDIKANSLHGKATAPTSCVAGEVADSNQIRITNNCATAQDFSNASLNFTSPDQAIWWVNGANGASTFMPVANIATKAANYDSNSKVVHVDFQAVAWGGVWGAEPITALQPKQSFLINLGTDATNISDIHVSGTTNAGGEVDNPDKKIKLTVGASPVDAVASQKAKVTITGPGYDKTVTFGKGWNSSKTVKNLVSGNYKIYVLPVHPLNNKGNKDKFTAYQGQADVANIVLSKDNKIQNIKISYNNSPIETGTIQVKLNQAAPVAGMVEPEVYLTQANTEIKVPAQALPWQGKVKFADLPVGNSYQIHVNDIDYNGKSYKVKLNKAAVDVVKGNSNVKVTYQEQQPEPAKQLPVYASVTGMPANAPETMVTLTGQHNDLPVIHQHLITPNFSGKFADMLEGDYSVNIEPDFILLGDKEYRASVTPNPIHIKDGTTNNIAINYTEIKPTPLPDADFNFAPFKMITEGYNWGWKTEGPNINELSAQSGTKDYILAFVLPYARGNTCEPAWDATMPIDTSNVVLSDGEKAAIEGIKTKIATLRGNDGDIAISFGGQNGGTMADGCATPQSLAQAYLKVINTYQPAFVDFDIEGAPLSQTTINQKRLDALKDVLKVYPNLKIQFTVPVDVNGFNAAAGHAFNQQVIKSGIPVFRWNFMAMAFYDSANDNESMGKNIVAATELAAAQLADDYRNAGQAVPNDLWQRIGVTPMIGVDWDTASKPSHIMYPADAQYIKQHLGDKVSLFSFWSADRDTGTCAGNNSPQTDCSGVAQTPFEFAKVFNGGYLDKISRVKLVRK